jgi:protein TonB
MPQRKPAPPMRAPEPEAAAATASDTAADPAPSPGGEQLAAVAEGGGIGDSTAVSLPGGDGGAGEPASAGAGAASAPAGEGGAGGVTDDYLARLSAWLERHKRYPRRSRLRSEEGVVLVRFEVGNDGSVAGFDIVKSSGHALLDEEAHEMLLRAQPLPRRAGLAGAVQLEVPVGFTLD